MENKQEDKTTCWYSNECSAEMNRFFDQYKASKEEAPHFKVMRKLVDILPKGLKVMDLGCGTSVASEYFIDHQYEGADLIHIINGCAIRNYPQYKYHEVNIVESDLKFISDYDVVLVNGVIDIMEFPMYTLEKLFSNCKDWIIIHRQEISNTQATYLKRNPSYNSTTYHSIINRNDFTNLLNKYNFEIVKELTLDFGNWEDGGHSFLLRKKKSYSLNKIDFKLNEIFGGKTGGIAIEAGANDGISQSNTAFFSFYKNWQTILIEPINEVFQQCAKNRMKDFSFNIALSSPENEGKEKIMRYYKGNNGLLSLLENNKEEKRTTEKPEFISVLCTTLNSILNRFSFEKYDLLSLDLEGGEEDALKGIDFDKHHIEWILIEHLECEDFNPAIYLNKWYVLHSALSEHDFLFKRRSLHKCFH